MLKPKNIATLTLAATLAATPLIPSMSVFASETPITMNATTVNTDGEINFADSTLKEAIQKALEVDVVTTENIKELTELVTTETITSLSGIEFATNLTTLHLSDFDIYNVQHLDVTVLRQLTNLVDVKINDYGLTVSDLDVFKSLPNLATLNLDYNNISSLTSLYSLENVQVQAFGQEVRNENAIIVQQGEDLLIPLFSDQEFNYDWVEDGSVEIIDGNFVWDHELLEKHYEYPNQEYVGMMFSGNYNYEADEFDNFGINGRYVQKIKITPRTEANVGDNTVDLTTGVITAPTGDVIMQLPILSEADALAFSKGEVITLSEGTLQNTETGLIVTNTQYEFVLTDTTLTINQLQARTGTTVATVDLLTGIVSVDGEEIGTLVDVVVTETGLLTGTYTANTPNPEPKIGRAHV